MCAEEVGKVFVADGVNLGDFVRYGVDLPTIASPEFGHAEDLARETEPQDSFLAAGRDLKQADAAAGNYVDVVGVITGVEQVFTGLQVQSA